jgi:hypothetical protein
MLSMTGSKDVAAFDAILWNTVSEMSLDLTEDKGMRVNGIARTVAFQRPLLTGELVVTFGKCVHYLELAPAAQPTSTRSRGARKSPRHLPCTHGVDFVNVLV